MILKVKKLNENAVIPSYAHKGDAGLDLFSCESVVLKPGERKTVATGIALEFPEGYVSLIWDKSGIGAKGITVLGGVIEHTYRGEPKVIMLNTSKEDYEIKKGQKIAQLLIQPIATVEIEEVSELSDTERGEGAFGSTGLSV
jgi:dUTP pyrophosphatase